MSTTHSITTSNGTRVLLSNALSRLGSEAAISFPACPDISVLDRNAHRECSQLWKDCVEVLMSVSGGRGLPILGDYDFGPLQNLNVSLRRNRASKPELIVGRHANGQKVILTSDGSVYSGNCERFLARTLIAFLERIAAEHFPCPARYALSIHARDKDDARKLARKLRAADNVFASTEYDACWSDDRWFIERDRAAARNFDDLAQLLAAACEAKIEIGLHDGRADAMLVETLQSVIEKPAYSFSSGIAAISIDLLPGKRIVQSLHYGDAGTEWAEWESGELLVQRRMPSVQEFSANADLQEYLFRRRVQRLAHFQRSEERLQALLGPRAWESVLSLEREHGGLIVEDDLSVWNLFHVFPLVAPGYIAETMASNERITSLRGEPVCQVGKIGSHLWLCIDQAGRFFTTGPNENQLEAGGGDLESALLKLALDEKHQRRRTDVSLGAYLKQEDAQKLIVALGHSMTCALDTFGYQYFVGSGFAFRQRKAGLGRAAEWHLLADSARIFCSLLSRIASPADPIRVLNDSYSLPTETETATCESTGIFLVDY